MASKVYENIRTTATKFANSYSEAFNSGDVSRLSSTLSASCHRTLAPATLLAAAPPQMAKGWTNKEYEDWLKFEFDMISKHETDIKSITVDEVAKKAVAYVLYTTTNKNDGLAWPFEFIFFLDFSEDGTVVEKIIQFVDSAQGAKFLQHYQLA